MNLCNVLRLTPC